VRRIGTCGGNTGMVIPTMNDVHQLPDPAEIEREASEWIARLNADDVSSEDRARFAAWRSSHPLNARVYEELSATLQRFVSAGPFVRAVSFAQSMNEAAAGPSSHSEALPRRYWAIAAAAAVAAAAVIGWFSFGRLGPGTTVSTAIGEQASISLPDGSTLELNSNSLAWVGYSKESRVIHLDRGEAFFKVAHDPQRPFWVVGGGSWVRAVGTAFDVYLKSGGVEVTVSEGTVKVGSADALTGGPPSDAAIASTAVSVLTVGQRADLHGTASSTRQLSPAEVQRSFSWREGTVYFENQPLSDVIAELGRYSSLELIVKDDALRRLPVGGTFKANPEGAEALLTMLEQGFGLHLSREGDRVYIEKESGDRAD
jgi:transmembrane sensor